MLFGIGKPPEPNRIDTIDVPGTVGCMGLVACPGVRVHQHTGVTRKHLELPRMLEDEGIWWLHLPIIDMEIPDQKYEDEWAVQGERIRHALRIGERVALHCYAGLGRTGMIGARLLVEMGMDNEAAIEAVRAPNPRRIQTKRQAMFVRQIRSLV